MGGARAAKGWKRGGDRGYNADPQHEAPGARHRIGRNGPRQSYDYDEWGEGFQGQKPPQRSRNHGGGAEEASEWWGGGGGGAGWADSGGAGSWTDGGGAWGAGPWQEDRSSTNTQRWERKAFRPPMQREREQQRDYMASADTKGGGGKGRHKDAGRSAYAEWGAASKVAQATAAASAAAAAAAVAVDEAGDANSNAVISPSASEVTLAPLPASLPPTTSAEPTAEPTASPAAGDEGGKSGEPDLPIDAHRDKILGVIERNRVTHIQGETGCGKSTRLPQFLLQDALARGESPPRIVVTQPRRMAAVTLARRVASVLGEELGAGTVGYRISGDSIEGHLCFVTVGYLLQRLVNNPEDFGRYTHVILDEVHERGVDADLLSMLVKLLMHCFQHVKLVVMSATLQASLFAEYFKSLSGNNRPAEVVFVGARMYPIELLFLDDLASQMDFSEGKEQRCLEQSLSAFAGIGKNGKGKGASSGKSKGKGGGEASGFRRVEPQISESLVDVTVSLVQQLAKPGCTVIVFLPGIADITNLFEALAPLDETRETQGRGQLIVRADCPKLRVFALHSMIPRTEQEEVFKVVPEDASHIVLASNIAESSLTLPSVCAVVDLALRRTVQYDTRRLMCCLVTTWCSQSSCKQRTGRAGRTMPGKAVCLVPRRFFDTQMPLFDPPEMLNAPLTKLYLQAKQLCSRLESSQERIQLPPTVSMNITAPKHLLNEVVQPPSMALLEAAMTELAAVGCLTGPNEEADITPLGRVAIALPCDLRICRLLYLGCLFRCPCDALAMAAGLTAADPFSAPSLLVLKDQKEYTTKLERSFASRRWCDNGTYSEPVMMHTLFVEWIRAGAPRGVKGLGQFTREWSVMPKKFESMVCDAIDLTVRMLKLLAPRNGARQSIEEMLASMHHGVDKHEELVRVSGSRARDRVFTKDVDRLRALVALAFSDQMLLYLSPRWATSQQNKKQRQEVVILDVMRKQKVELHRTAAMFVPQTQDEETMKELCTAMCGQAPESVFHEKKNKVILVTYPADMEANHLGDGEPLLWDVPAAIHRLHQFGSGRYRFFVERPGGEEAVELFKPLQPFLLQWEVLTHPGHGHHGGGKKKAPTVRGMCDWRNPLGFACHADPSTPPTEFLGCCASIQGLEGGAQAFVAGTTVLPLKFLPVLLGTLCPERWQLQWGIDESTREIRGVKILHYEIVSLPPKILASRVLEVVNSMRSAIREALVPESWWEEWDEWEGSNNVGNGRGKTGRRDAYLDPEDLSDALAALLEALPTKAAMPKPKKMRWRSAAPPYLWDEDWLGDENLRQLRPLAEKDGPAATGAKGGAADKGSQRGASGKGKQISLAKQLAKKRPPDFKQFGKSPAAAAGAAQGAKHSSGRGGGKGWNGASGAASSGGSGAGKGRKGGAWTAQISRVCDYSPAQAGDFDGRVMNVLRDICEKKGSEAVEEAFRMLQEWLSKKENRDDVINWAGYIMRLLNRWRDDSY